jgi:hypothetical protein
MRKATFATVVAAMVGTAGASAQTRRSDIQAWPSAAVTASVGGRTTIEPGYFNQTCHVLAVFFGIRLSDS